MLQIAVLDFFRFLQDIVKSRRLISALTKDDFRSRYLGSCLGFIWAFINPVLTILILWFVFEIGFKVRPVDDFPFILWLTAGMVPWFFISDSIISATNSIIEKSFLVQKVVFRVSTLPIIKILSALVIHLFFTALLIALFLLHGRAMPLTTVQIVYYLFAACVFILGLTWMTSALIIFLRDIGQVVGILLQFGFWLTPIFWSIDIVPAGYRSVIKLNPLYYIIQGYRESLINQVWFWEHRALTIYFWGVTGLLLIVGALLFRRLRLHFADVL
jgi:lipopolysaccharide transport system permease protein/teichoic acid transport system permease protein